MTDNVTITPGSGATIAADIVGGVHVQRVKNAFGGDGVATDVSQADPLPVTQEAATLHVTATGAAAAAVTATLPAPGAGLFHYITALEVVLYNTAARTGSATPVLVTTTNLPGTPAFTFPSAGAVGSVERRQHEFPSPLKSAVANTATTIVGPATTAVIWRINVTSFTAP